MEDQRGLQRGIERHHKVVGADDQTLLIRGDRWPIRDDQEMCGFLADFCCTFSAPKRVAIGRPQGTFSAFAGFTYWLLFFGIAIVYVIVYQIMYQNAHLKYEAPMGSVRLSFERPTKMDETLGHRCAPSTPGCENNFTDVRDLAYCSRSDMEYSYNKHECRIWDEDSIVARNLGMDVILASFARVHEQNRICDGRHSNHTTCPHTFHTNEKENYYIAGVEDFTVTIQHSMRTPALLPEIDMKERGLGVKKCVDHDAEVEGHRRERRLRGDGARNHSDSGGHLSDITECGFLKPDATLSSEDDPYDTFRLGDLLSIAGIDLDKPSHVQPSDTTRRESGTTMVMTIHYTNTVPWKMWYKAFWETFPVKYYFTVLEMPVDNFKIRDSQWEQTWNSDSRLVVEQSGLRIIVLFTGKLGSWSWKTLLVLLSVSMTTIFMAESLVVYIIRFCPCSWTSGRIRPAHLAEHYMDYAQDISDQWRPVLDKNIEIAQGRATTLEGESQGLLLGMCGR
eukprot:TRINITY_DN108040_c0_g1_i1.p1 TRINITY_DN108040_c0_g1~~TRINITY_DN108040_c0_g1_i1.p1  ORF type:complete len:507 (+),score=37.76 TRINITY_DN108040_c0_g1_i1:60-1580(+)